MGALDRKVAVITGATSGIGASAARLFAAEGADVVIAGRRRQEGEALAERLGQSFFATDVTVEGDVEALVAHAVERFGRLDVIVNNAGYANVSPIETTDDADFRAQFETNFWGVYHVSKAAIPVLRQQGGGLVMQISSVGGRVGGSPGIASYQAAKFAIDGFSRVLRTETAPFGVKVIVVEPSGFRTDWAGSSMTVHDVPEAYASTVGAMNSRFRQNDVGPAGDPARAAAILVQVAKRRDIPDHLPLGVNAVEGSIRLDERLLAEDRRWNQVGRSADFSEPFPVEFPADTPT